MNAPLPHEDVWTRLGVSRISGVGVFAIRPIPAGTNVFANDQAQMHWIDARQLGDELSPAEKQLYSDFTVRRGTRLACPANFNLLTVGWYVNEPPQGVMPNLFASASFEMIASRDIAEGEELTVIYETFSDPP